MCNSILKLQVFLTLHQRYMYIKYKVRSRLVTSDMNQDKIRIRFARIV